MYESNLLEIKFHKSYRELPNDMVSIYDTALWYGCTVYCRRLGTQSLIGKNIMPVNTREVMEVQLSCYLVLLSVALPWPNPYRYQEQIWKFHCGLGIHLYVVELHELIIHVPAQNIYMIYILGPEFCHHCACRCTGTCTETVMTIKVCFLPRLLVP